MGNFNIFFSIREQINQDFMKVLNTTSRRTQGFISIAHTNEG